MNTISHRSLVAVFWSALLTACGPGGEVEQKEHAEEEGGHHEEGKAGEIRLEAEAIERAGIRTGIVERRALGGGMAVPAEIEFEPTSLAHVGPLVPGRFVKVAVALGDRVERGQLLGVVAEGAVAAARARLGQSRARLIAAESAVRRQQQLSTEGIGAQRSLIG